MRFLSLFLISILPLALLAKPLPPGSKLSQKPNVLFIIDNSGSMGGSKMSQTKAALTEIFAESNMENLRKVRLGISRFPNHVDPMILVPVRDGSEPGHREALLNSLGSIVANGWTPLEPAMKYAQQYFWGNAKSGEKYSYSGYSKTICGTGSACDTPITNKCQKNYIILFTDGAPCCASSDSYSSVEAKAKEIAWKGLQNFTIPDTSETIYYPGIVTIPIGFGTAVKYIADGAAAGNGQLNDSGQKYAEAGDYYNASNKETVKNAFNNILAKLASKEITSTTPTLVPSFNPQEEDVIYQSIFKPMPLGDLWQGFFYKYELDASGFPKASPEWEMNNKLTSPDSRKIYTSCENRTEFKAEYAAELSQCMAAYGELGNSGPATDWSLTDSGWDPCGGATCSSTVSYEVLGTSVTGADQEHLHLYLSTPQFQAVQNDGAEYLNDGMVLMTPDDQFYLIGGDNNNMWDCGDQLPEIIPTYCSTDADCGSTGCLKTVSYMGFPVPVSAVFTGATGICADLGNSCTTHTNCNPASNSYCGTELSGGMLNQCVKLDGIQKVYTSSCSAMDPLQDHTHNSTNYKYVKLANQDQISAFYFANSNTSTDFLSLKYYVEKVNYSSDVIFSTLGDYRRFIRYLRGYETYKTSASCTNPDQETMGACETRHMLADIYNSRAKYFGVPHQNYTYTSYKTFKTDKNSRKGNELLFMSSNDGMLHAVKTGSGEELFAYLPPNILPLLRNMLKENKAAPNGIFTTDGTPKIMDIYDGSKWRSVLIMGFGEGGEGLFALDITDVHAGSSNKPKFLWAVYNDTPSFNSNTSKRIYYWYPSGSEVKMNIYAEGLSASDATGSELVLTTEYDYSHLDLSWSEPVIAQMGSTETNPGTFYAVFGAGGTNSSHSGQGNRHFGGAVFMVDPLTGKIAKQFIITDPANRNVAPRFAGVPAILPDFQLAQNREMHSIYMADLSGAIWRMDPEATASGGLIDCPGSGCVKLFDFESTKQKKNYIYHSLAMSYDGNPSEGEASTNLWLYFGTGDHSMEGIKESDAGENYLVALKDPTWESKSTTATLTLSNLTRVASNNTTIPTTSKGWYFELFGSSGSLKLVADPTIIDGYVYFSAYDPATTTTSPCDAGTLGVSYLYSFNLFDASYNPDFKDLTDNSAEPQPRGLLGTGIATAPVLKGNAMYFGISGEAASGEKPIFDQGERRKNLIKWERSNAVSGKKTVVPFNYFREIF